jgi:hypothetical protein
MSKNLKGTKKHIHGDALQLLQEHELHRVTGGDGLGLDPSQVAAGNPNDAGGPADGQVAGVTSANNFINFNIPQNVGRV